MREEQARRLVKDSFEKPFDRGKFCLLVKNLLNNMDETKPFPRPLGGSLISKGFRDHIKTLDRVGQYKDTDGKIIDILIVCLKKETSLDRARAKQRNYIAKYLKEDRRGQFKDGALVAFISPGEEDWRFSFIKIDYKFDEKGKIKDELTPARRYSFLVGKNEASHTAQSSLISLLQKDDKNPSIKDLEQAFSVERVTKEFFEKYRELFHKLKESLDKIINEDKKIKKDFSSKGIYSADFAKKLLGQIVFLYFLQKKGWFGVERGKDWGTGSKHFLRELFNKHSQKPVIPALSGNPETKQFFNNILEPLFYEALGLRHEKDYYSRFDCRIPFLNGGLFEPLKAYDWVNTDILLPDSLFSNKNKTKEGDIGDGILDIFDRYNFTVNEDEPLEKEVAIDPEMLGKVFENLLEVRDRKSKGTYYTPREIVHYMCQESLINYLFFALSQQVPVPALQPSSPSHSVFPTKPAVPKKLVVPAKAGTHTHSVLSKNPVVPMQTGIQRSDIEIFIKISDSSLEHDTVYQEKQLEKALKGKTKTTSRYDKSKLPKAIIENAFLIDRALADIRICDPAVGSGAFPVGMMNEVVRARNVLTPFIKSPAKAGIHTLPDKGGQGGLRSPYHFKRHAIEHSLYGVDIDPSAIEIAKLRLWLSLVVDEEDRDKIQPLPNLDYKMLCGHSLLGIEEIEKDLFNMKQFNELEKLKLLYFNETSARKKQKFKQEIEQFIDKITDGKKIFDFEIYFSEVFQEKQGFDIVIANPPYVKEGVNKSAFDGLRKSLYYQGKMDLWYLFACKSIDISRPGSGVIAFIAQNNWVTSHGAKKMRNKVIKDSQILSLLDFGDFKVFSAGIQTMVMLFQKNNFMEEYSFDYRRLSGKNLKTKDMISLLNKEQNQNAEYLSSKIQREKLKNKNLNFSNSKVESILNKMLSQVGFQLKDKEVGKAIEYNIDTLKKKHMASLYLTDREVAQGAVFPQDFVNKKSKAKLKKAQFKVGDGVFVLSDKEKNNIPLTKKELSLIKPYYTTKELFRWFGDPKNKQWVIYTDSSFKDKSKMKEYPNIKKHLDQFKKIITSDNKPYGLHRSRRESFFKGEKIIAVRKCTIPTFSYIDFDSYVSATFYVIQSSRLNLKYLTALFNSKLIAFWLRHKGKMQGNNYQIDKEPIMSIPLMNPPATVQKPIIDLVDKILNVGQFKKGTKAEDYLKDPAKQAKVQQYEKQIDQLVYKLYNLTPSEIKIIENSLSDQYKLSYL